MLSYIRNITRRMATKASRAFAVSLSRRGTSSFSSGDYRTYVQDGYKRVVWVYRCVREKSEAIGSVPWKVMLRQSDGQRKPVDEKHKAGQQLKRLITHPNPLQTTTDLFEDWAAFLALGGSSFVEIVRSKNSEAIKRFPLELWSISPQYMKIKADAEAIIGGYSYEYQGSKHEYELNEILYWKLLDPLDPIRGMSPLEAGWRIVQTEASATEWNKQVFDNAAVPSGVLIYKGEGALTKEQLDDLNDRLVEGWSGENRHRPLALHNMEWKQWSMSQKDMDFLALKGDDALNICALFGVPPELVGAVRPKYENYEIARLVFWEETVITELERAQRKLQNELVPMFEDDRLELCYDVSNVPAMRTVFIAKVTTAERLMNMGFTRNEVNARLDLGFESVPWGDEALVPGTLIPASAIIAGDTLQGAKPEASDKPEKANLVVLPVDMRDKKKGSV